MPECKNHKIKYDKGKKCRQCNTDAVTRRRKKIKQMAVEYMGGKCSRCAYDKCIAALEFHHLDPSEKDFALGNKGHTRSWDRVVLELNKCILLCANCHREVENGDIV